MSRDFICENAVVLRLKPQGESNREAWFLCADCGLVKATVFGGAKSRLRAQVAPFHQGKLWGYREPVRGNCKVTDFEVRSYRLGLRDSLERLVTAAAVAETVLAFHGGGGSWAEAVSLTEETLDRLEGADAAACGRLGVCFMWRWAGVMEVRPEAGGRALEAGLRSWLVKIETLPIEELIACDTPLWAEAKAFSKKTLADALGKKLNLWDEL